MLTRILTVRFPADKDAGAFLSFMLQERFRKDTQPVTTDLAKALMDALQKGGEDDVIQAAVDAAFAGSGTSWTVYQNEAQTQRQFDNVKVGNDRIEFEWTDGLPGLETELWLLCNLARFDEKQAFELVQRVAHCTATVNPYSVTPAT